MNKSVILYPGPGVGHLTPMVQLAKVFLQHGADVTVVLVEPLDLSAAVAREAASNPSITFHVLPPPSSAPEASNSDGTPKHHIVQIFDSLGAMNEHLRDFLRSVPSIDAFVIDMFCSDALDVAAELELPVYFFYASAAGDLAIFLHMPSINARMTKSYKSNGILVNSFESLETRAVRALRDGLCVPDRATPPVYCIGPLVSAGGGEKEHECLRWLDAQPDKSVVFLSFGSMGTFPKKQLEEIAIGLEKSGHRFLWVVRTPPGDDYKLGEPLPEPDLGALLPDGFLERTKETGLVLKSWAPQVDVLNHRATGAFVTHCGWNSTLEGVTAGLPLLCWPMYAEQRMNKMFIVEELKLGVELKGYDKEIVQAEVVETKVKWVMDSEGGRALRECAESAKKRAAEAIKKGGSSRVAFAEFLNKL
ncbi:hypothetical protein PR202_ga09764 [Eleusine coracana subsp. coracana]|uniref:Glycosyltransferase n=1 Tax=Eleusine coracana subsp. coracana TaxID=191504 RepID=A0AAV5C562_ELECO|nr:hypothetical protein PR202_ga09764 [Eleusine coracana subsp. coracana]